MHRRFVYAAVGACSLGFALSSMDVSSLAAQQLRELTVSEANAQLDLWLRPYRRPDDNYTNGTHLAAVFDAAPLWGRFLAPHTPPCDPGGARVTGGSCASTEVQFGQDMYTPTSARRTPEPVPGERPYAGGLYVSGTARIATPTRCDAFTLEAGMSGTPSLAEKVQSGWHALIRYRRALGWSHQIPFEPGVLLGYEHAAQVVGLTAGGTPVLSLIPHIGASVGNVLTGASAGIDGRFGYHVTTPWSAATS